MILRTALAQCLPGLERPLCIQIGDAKPAAYQGGGCQWFLNKLERPRCSFNRYRAMEGDFQKGNPVLLPHLGLYSKLHSLPTIPLPSLLFNSLSSTLALSPPHSPLIIILSFFLSTFLSSLLFTFHFLPVVLYSPPILSFPSLSYLKAQL